MYKRFWWREASLKNDYPILWGKLNHKITKFLFQSEEIVMKINSPTEKYLREDRRMPMEGHMQIAKVLKWGMMRCFPGTQREFCIRLIDHMN